ncbi:MAG: hypothetical protein L3J87_04245 [Thermoplasmata archaeon]|nr:hypothetical protein [Thermoplasmata archaeon]
MRAGRAALFWIVIIGLLLLVEFAELTHLFTVPFQIAFANFVSFIVALVFTTILALVGAVFIGIYISHRMQSPTGFTVFEEEMLKMRGDVQALRHDLEAIKERVARDPPSPAGPRPSPPERP